MSKAIKANTNNNRHQLQLPAVVNGFYESLEEVSRHIMRNPEALQTHDALAPLRHLMSDLVQRPNKYWDSVEQQRQHSDDDDEEEEDEGDDDDEDDDDSRKRPAHANITEDTSPKKKRSRTAEDNWAANSFAYKKWKKKKKTYIHHAALSRTADADDITLKDNDTLPTATTKEPAAAAPAAEAPQFEFRVTETQAKTWRQRVEELAAYKQEHGHCNVPQKYPPNPALGEWVKNQRKQKRFLEQGKMSHLTLERQKDLEDIGFCWNRRAEKPTTSHMPWDEYLDELIHYKQEHGDCDVPQTYAPNPTLGRWVMRQRKEKRLLDQGKDSSILTPARLWALQGLGFAWSVNTGRTRTASKSWDERIHELVQYKKEHGDCLVPRNYPPNQPLGEWVHNMRNQQFWQAQGKKSTMTLSRFQELQDLGFTWAERRTDRDERLWQERFKELVLFKQQHGHCKVPRSYALFPALGAWVAKQRKMKCLLDQGKDSTLTLARLQALEELDFTWQTLTLTIAMLEAEMSD